MITAHNPQFIFMSDEKTHTPEVSFEPGVAHDFYAHCFAAHYGKGQDSNGLLGALRTCVQKHIQVFNIVSQQSTEFLEARPLPVYASGEEEEEEAEEDDE